MEADNAVQAHGATEGTGHWSLAAHPAGHSHSGRGHQCKYSASSCKREIAFSAGATSKCGNAVCGRATEMILKAHLLKIEIQLLSRVPKNTTCSKLRIRMNFLRISTLISSSVVLNFLTTQ